MLIKTLNNLQGYFYFNLSVLTQKFFRTLGSLMFPFSLKGTRGEKKHLEILYPSPLVCNQLLQPLISLVVLACHSLVLDGFVWHFHASVHSLSSAVNKSLRLRSSKFFWERRELSPGLLGEKRKRYLCAMQPPNCFNHFTIAPQSKYSKHAVKFSLDGAWRYHTLYITLTAPNVKHSIFDSNESTARNFQIHPE